MRRSRFLDGTLLTARTSQGRSLIKSIQRGTITIANATASNTATITAVDPNNAIVHGLGNTVNEAPNSSFVRVTLTNSTTVTATRSGTVSANTVNYEVIEYWPGLIKSVQRGTITLNSVTSATATITAVDTTKTMVEHLGASNTDASGGNGQLWLTTLVLTNATTVTAAVNTAAANSPIVGYQVIEWF